MVASSQFDLNIFKNVDYRYILNGSITLRPDSSNGTKTDLYEVLRRVMMDLTTSDMHILQALAHLKFSTVVHLHHYAERYNDVFGQSVMANDLESLKHRVDKIHKCGLLFAWKVEYLSHDTTMHYTYYTLSPYAFKVLKNQLNFKDEYNDAIAATHFEDSIKYLAVNGVGCVLKKCKSISSWDIGKQTFWQEQRKKIHLFGRYVYNSGEGDSLLIIEPIRFGRDKFRLTEERFNEDMEERLTFLSNYVFSKVSHYNDVKVLFLCEDIQGIQNTVQIVAAKAEAMLAYSGFTIDLIPERTGGVSSGIVVSMPGAAPSFAERFVNLT